MKSFLRLRHLGITVAVFFTIPVFVYAAGPYLTTYTLSADTIHPGTSTTIDIAFSEKVKASIKILTPNDTEITLYSSSGVTNPNPKDWDGTDSNGAPVAAGVYTIYISAASIADPSQTMTDSSKKITVVASGSDSGVASSTPEQPAPSGSAAMEKPIPPPSLSIEVSGDQDALLGVPAHFSARAVSKGGATDASARIFWSFGDGSSQEGIAVEKTYRYAGTYLVTATASDGPVSAHGDVAVTVTAAHVRITAVSSDGIVVTNDAAARLDLSGWWLETEKASARLPVGAALLPNASVLFPFSVLHLPVAFDARLLFPDGALAARFAAAAQAVPVVEEAAVQPDVPQASYKQVQTVESVTSTEAPMAYDNAVTAPATTEDPVVAGAAQEHATGTAPADAPAEDPPAATAAVAAAPTAGLLHSPWTAGFLGVVLIAGSAFIFL